MTQWVPGDLVGGGRPRGPRGLAEAWVGVLLGPTRFFCEHVVPGDQAPGLVFAVVVVLLEEASRFALVPDAVPAVGGLGPLAALLALLVAGLLVAPAVLHLVAAIQTALLVPFAPDRGGVSETVQVLAYASAPCVVVGIPHPMIRLAGTLWGAGLLFVGLQEVHGLSAGRSVVLGAIPAALVFGYGFRGFDALVTVLQGWYII